MMAKEREIRYQSPAELIADIEQQIHGKKSLEYRPGEDPTDFKKPFADGPPQRSPSPFKRRPRR